ncbi:fiber 1 [Psittacine aviadenovirus B]|uniref:Fiber 1 n=1 Tax=psittacine adenovirus 4 TaxID=2773287 RepID=A0A1P8SW85_9ADEN|nr:fiber 1 [Psittacine aviadenovirus B]APY28363.1 fiber 1 [psittacine adenovirus 4]
MTLNQYLLGVAMPHTKFVLPGARSWVPEVPPPKRPRLLTVADNDSTNNENETTLNLVYPFWWTTGLGGGGTPGGGSGSGTNITVNPAGPLVLENGVLSVQLYNPIVLNSGAIRLAFDGNTLALSNQDEKLMVKTSAPLVKGGGGGITLGYDPSMFGLSATNGALQILLAPNNNPLSTSTSGLTLNYDPNMFGLNAGALQLLVDSAGPLSSSSSGLTLNADPTYFTVNNGQLSFNAPSYVSPYAVFEVTSTSWRTYSGTVRSSASNNWSVSYKCLIVNSGGLCNGVINICLPRTSVSSAQSPISFTFVLCLSVGQSSVGASNLSTLNTPTVTPAGGNRYFYPTTKQEVGSYLGVDPDSWYISPSTQGLTKITFNPISAGSTTFSQATCGYSQGTLSILEGAVPPLVMVFTYSIPINSGSWAGSGSSTSGDLLVTGPLSFSYQGAPYSAAQWNQA